VAPSRKRRGRDDGGERSVGLLKEEEKARLRFAFDFDFVVVVGDTTEQQDFED
jgi:hypothetical protein